MQKDVPVQNKLLSRRWQDQQLYTHRQRLLDMQASNNIKAIKQEPPRYPHLESKAKKFQLQEGK